MAKKMLMDVYLFEELKESVQDELVSREIEMNADWIDDCAQEVCKEAISESNVLSEMGDIKYEVDRYDIVFVTAKGPIDISKLSRHLIEKHNDSTARKSQLTMFLSPGIIDIAAYLKEEFEQYDVENYDIATMEDELGEQLIDGILENMDKDLPVDPEDPYYTYISETLKGWVDYFTHAAVVVLEKELELVRQTLKAHYEDSQDYDRVRQDLAEQSRIEQRYYDAHGSLVYEGGDLDG
jgi:hypothetical protein